MSWLGKPETERRRTRAGFNVHSTVSARLATVRRRLHPNEDEAMAGDDAIAAANAAVQLTGRAVQFDND